MKKYLIFSHMQSAMLGCAGLVFTQDFSRAAKWGFNGDEKPISISPELIEKIKAYFEYQEENGQRCGIPFEMLCNEIIK